MSWDERTYEQLMERARGRSLPRGSYFESHHIVPRSLGGSDERENIVKLTAREHYIAHWLLYRITPRPNKSKMACAWARMCTNVDGLIVSSKEYERAKIARQKLMKERTVSPETRQQISNTLKGRSPANKGVPASPEQRRKNGEKKKGNTYNRGRKHTEQSRANMSRAQVGHVPWNKGKKIGSRPEINERKRKWMKGHFVSDETRTKLSVANTGKASPFKGIPRSEATKRILKIKKQIRDANVRSSQTSLSDIDQILMLP